MLALYEMNVFHWMIQMGSKAPGVQAHVQVPGPPRSPSPGSEPSYAKPFKSRNLSQSSSANSSLQVGRTGVIL